MPTEASGPAPLDEPGLLERLLRETGLGNPRRDDTDRRP